MLEDYEYRAFDFDTRYWRSRGGKFATVSPPSMEEIRAYAKGYLTPNVMGWEITHMEYRHHYENYLSAHQDMYSFHAEARRPRDHSAVPRSWEYLFFRENATASANWHRHIASCGWTSVDGGADLFKRPDSWIGIDDGDILYQLEVNGMKVRREFWEADIVEQIIATKWLLSEKAGHDIGTYEAVREWLASRV